MKHARSLGGNAVCAFLLVLLVSACAGSTQGSTNVTQNSATLKAVGSCTTSCQYWFQYRVAGTTAWTETPGPHAGPVGTNTSTAFSADTGAVLAPSTNYQFQTCGDDTAGLVSGCAGPDGSSNTVGTFTTLASTSRPVAFDGTYANPNMWPSVYGSCYTPNSSTQATFNITSACNPAGNGHYRTDLCSSAGCRGNGVTGDVYTAGIDTCTSVPVNIASAGTVPSSGWLMVAEAKDYSAAAAGWGMYVYTNSSGQNEFQISFDWNLTKDKWIGGSAAPGWHTLSICTNNGNSAATGKVYGIYEDGQQLTFNQGFDAGKQSLSGFAIIDNGMSSWPLDVDAYTGGAPVPSQIIHGDPLVSYGSTPPMPAGGWNSP